MRFREVIIQRYDRLCSANQFVLDTPVCYWEVIKAAGGLPAPRESHPSEDRSELPPLVATDHGAYSAPLQRSTLWPDRSIVSPIACHRHAGGRPALRACRFSFHTGQDRPKTSKFRSVASSLSPDRYIVAQQLMWLMLITIAMGMCLMNGYSIFKEHGGQKKAPHFLCR